MALSICAMYMLEIMQTKWATRQWLWRIKNPKKLWDILIQSDKQVMAKQPDIVLINKKRKQWR